MKKLLDQIKTLSVRDKKTLSQKGLKLMEEAGELAKAILPYEGACGTNHRLPNAEKIAEECADTLLVAYSILKSLGMEDGDIIDIVQRKTDYWQFLQENEHLANLDNLVFEMHVTVKEINDLETFKADCAELNVKPIILDLFAEGEVIKDMMTSSHYKGTTKGAVEYSRKLVTQLRDKGYVVVREKIETVPWHPASKVAHLKSPQKYYEAHVAFPADVNPKSIAYFEMIFNMRFSRNTMKKGDQSVQMGTLRRDCTIGIDAFTQLLNDVVNDANTHHDGLRITEQPVIEYALFDDNQTHDKKWISA
jgi:NTP pyrophosphatase (non-canonical NTP hydrolase)